MKWAKFLLVVSLVVVAVGCGGEDGETVGSEAPAEPVKESESASTGGLTCGSATCVLPDALEGQEICCVDQFNGTCGVKMNGTCRPLPTSDDRCPLPMVSSMMAPPGTMVIGCCAESGECGVDFGLGCQSITSVCNLVSPNQAKNLKAMTCDGEPLELPADCGMSGGLPPPPAPPAAGSGG